MNHLAEFIEAMTAAGCGPARTADVIADRERPADYQIEGDPKGHKKGWYILRTEGDFARGSFGDRRQGGDSHNWHSKSNRKFTAEEKAAWAKKRDDARRQADIEQAERHKAAIARAKAIWSAGKPADPAHAYLTRKQAKVNGLRQDGDLLLVPMYAEGVLFNVQTIAADGEKLFIAGGRKKGCYYPLATKDEPKDVMVICEGLATGDAVRQATALPVIVAFDAGNLKPVAQALRAKYPETKFIFAADNDQFTRKPDGSPWNPGIEKAREAAASIDGGAVVWPEFPEDDAARRTDFNDLFATEGISVVRDRIAAISFAEPPAAMADPDPISVSDDGYVQEDRGASYQVDEAPVESKGDMGMRFRILGYNNGHYYYFPFKARQIVSLTASGHTIQNLLQLDTLDAWERKFSGADKISTTKMVLYSMNEMIAIAQERGVFQEEDRVRGGGAWIDEGRVVLHCGDAVYVDGQRIGFNTFRSYYSYVAAAKLIEPSAHPLGNFDAHKLRRICELVTWENKLSGSLLAGWLVIAPLCSALMYRPHIYITGEAESGKSTVMDRIIKPVLGRFSLNVDGGTTEPAIREMMAYDGRPLIFDEAEPSLTMNNVIELARKASTGSTVKKFGQRPFKARFCACFSAINPPINKTADESRISFMVIKKNRKPTAAQEYEDLLAMIEETITDDYPARLLARTLANFNNLVHNIRVFQKAARVVLGSPRASQQIGTMLAGLYLLGRTDRIEPETAEKWIREYDWTDHTIIDQEGDPARLAQHLASSLVRYGTGGGHREASVGDLIEMVHRGMDDHDADKTLRYHGIAVKSGFVDIANRSQNLGKLLKDTEWSVKWSRTLLDVAGAEKRKSVYFASGVKGDAVRLPISVFCNDEKPPIFDKELDL
ncbi:MAG: toprim domain-containing protein [Janthinobacterium lividum]